MPVSIYIGANIRRNKNKKAVWLYLCCMAFFVEKKERRKIMVKEKIGILAEKTGNDPDVLALIQEMVDACANYVDTVVNMENIITVYRFKANDPSDYRAMVQRLDQTRRLAHNALISLVRAVDRLAKINNAEPVYGGHDEDRTAIAEFAKAVVDEYFEGRQK
jgi:hypothetical protein